MDYKKLATEPLNIVFQLVGAKWKFLIVKELLQKDMRFVELKKKLGCTAKVLTTCLKEMEKDDLVIRNDFKTQPPRVEYSLTDIGKTLLPVIKSIESWGKDYKKLRKLMEKIKCS